MFNFMPGSANTRGLLSKLLPIIGLMAIISGCTTTETQIVDRPAIITTTPSDALPVSSPSATLKIRIGEIEPIHSMDPLFAQTESTKRLAGLIFEGLVQYDFNGNIVPLLASNWTISDDSLRYTFTLNRKASFQDSPQFIDGKGRRVLASDVKATFSRMATRQVPPEAANTFSDIIQGMDAYNRERRELFFPDHHSLSEIRGIIAENDSTVIFNLTRPNRGFLDALASPFGFITPKEFREPHHQRPVGTGPYRLDRRQSDTLFVLQLDPSYWNQSDNIIRPAVAEIRRFRTESTLLAAFRRNEIDIIPDLSPVTRLSLTDTDGNLSADVLPEANFVSTTGTDRVELRFNQGYRHTSGFAQSTILHYIDLDSLANVTARVGISIDTITAATAISTSFQANESARSPGTLAFFENSYEGYLSRILYQSVEEKFPLALVKTGVQSREITWYTRYVHSWEWSVQAGSPHDSSVLAVFLPSRLAAVHHKVAGIQFNKHPWWLRLDGIHLDYSVPAR